MNNKMQLTAPCLFGLESIVKFELAKIGATNINPENGRVNFEGDERIVARANLWLRTAERVSIVLGSFKATTFTQLFDGVNKLPFEEYIGEFDEFPVKGWSIDSQLQSIPSCQSIIKKSVVKRMESVFHHEIFQETGALHQITFSIHKDIATIMLDTTGIALHKRGYRQNANLAPIRETLAAGIIDLARLRSNDQVYDPMCGSGTLLIEAAQRSINLAPGLSRSFAAEQWGVSKKKIWTEERDSAKKAIDKSVEFHGYGSDIDRAALSTAKQNARLAGVEDFLTFSYSDVKDFRAKSPSTVICNPPYGERLLDKPQAEKLFKTMGESMEKVKDVSYYIIGPPEEFEASFGRPADRRRKLYNGMLQCQLYMYFK